jgi:hypothetical protein
MLTDLVANAPVTTAASDAEKISVIIDLADDIRTIPAIAFPVTAVHSK